VTITLAVALSGCQPSPEPPGPGAATYQTYCALCHGDEGEGYAADHANQLANPDFLAAADDTFLTAAITDGRPGTPMSAWGEAWSGPLDGATVARLVAHLRDAQTVPAIDPSTYPVEGGLASLGEPVFTALCASCHGESGQGKSALSLTNPQFLVAASDAYLRHAIEVGRRGTPMKGYAAELSTQSILDVIAWLRSKASPPPAARDVDTKASLDDPLLNPGGPSPAWPANAQTISVDALRAALDAGTELVILDARAPSDYLVDHISGAANAPFYEPDLAIAALDPADPVVAYCACPHAASDTLAAALREAGFGSVAVLDEGYLVWKERGYPVTAGPAP
jgi:cytochrome c oxidase cbb3-type subunit 3/ubiquinol-cytochrome c reductase cytochrome c subunit